MSGETVERKQFWQIALQSSHHGTVGALPAAAEGTKCGFGLASAFGPINRVLLTWIVDGDVYGSLFARSWVPIWQGRISSKFNPRAMNMAPYVRSDVRLSGEPNADMDVSLQFGFTRYGEVESSAQSDDSLLVVWRERDGQLYSRSFRVVPVQSEKEVTAGSSNRDVTALVRYKARDIRFDDNASAFDFDIALVNASSSAPVPVVARRSGPNRR
jgi:hypothetical protein